MNFPLFSYIHGAATSLAILATLLPLVRLSSRWFRFFDFPRAQVAFILLILLATLWWAYSDYKVLIGVGVALIGALALQFYWIFPFTPLARKEVKSIQRSNKSRTFKVLIYNVRMKNRDYQPFLDRIKGCDPDLILANEVDKWWVNKIEELKAEYPYQVLQPQGNTYGMALYSKLKLSEVQVMFQVEKDIPSIHCQVHLKDGSIFDFHGIHPKPPNLHNDTEARDAELVITGIKIKEKNKPALVAGDLNDVAWSYTSRLFKRLSGMLDPRTGRGFYNTYSVFLPFFRYPLDHLFITNHFRLVNLQRLPACGSDHFPVMATLEYVPEKRAAQPVEKPDSADINQAGEILEEAGKSNAKVKKSL